MNDLALFRMPSRQYAGAIIGALFAFSASAALVDNFPVEIRTSAVAGPATTVAYNQPNNSTGFYQSNFEYGVQATLDPGAPNVIRVVKLPYFSNFNLVNGFTYRVYANNGPLVGGFPSPGTKLSERTEDIVGPGTTTYTVSYDFGTGANVLPPTVTVTMQFAGIGGPNQAGWVTSSAANTVGSHPNFFWERDNANQWQLRTFAVPEPDATVAAGALALVGFAAIRFYCRSGK